MASQPAERHRTPGDATAESPIALPTPHSRKVVIVEDEAPFRRIIARNLATRGVDVREAETASQAITAVVDVRPDLLLLDINLPDRTGWDVLRELRRRNMDVPTIVISAVRVPASRLQEFRPLAYLPKPFPLEALLRLVVGAAGVESGEQVPGTTTFEVEEDLDE